MSTCLQQSIGKKSIVFLHNFCSVSPTRVWGGATFTITSITSPTVFVAQPIVDNVFVFPGYDMTGFTPVSVFLPNTLTLSAFAAFVNQQLVFLGSKSHVQWQGMCTYNSLTLDKVHHCQISW